MGLDPGYRFSVKVAAVSGSVVGTSRLLSWRDLPESIGWNWERRRLTRNRPIQERLSREFDLDLLATAPERGPPGASRVIIGGGYDTPAFGVEHSGPHVAVMLPETQAPGIEPHSTETLCELPKVRF